MVEPRRGQPRRLLVAALVLGVATCVVVVFENILLNLTLPAVINHDPDRVRVDYSAAWMVVPGRVQVRDLRIRNQGRTDQWLVSADRASGRIFLHELLERRFHATEVHASGVSVRYRRRLDAVAGAPDAPPVETSAPPIEGLSNPPDPAPDFSVARQRWLVVLDAIVAEDVNELWIGDYRLVGEASAVADVSLGGSFVDVDGVLSVRDMGADLGDAPVAENITGELHLGLDGLDRDNLGRDRLQALDASAELEADVQDLRFLDFYLATVPWIALAGVGHVAADVQLDDGQFRIGSTLGAYFPELVVRFLDADVIGAGELHAEVVSGSDGKPQSRIVADFDDFAITRDGSADALVVGVGFHLEASSPDVDLEQPFTAITASLDLPESRIPDFAMYNTFLPEGVGLAVRSGTGTVRGHLVASSVTDHASGDLYLKGQELVVGFDPFVVTGDLDVHAKLTDTWLGTGWYDISGTTATLRNVGMIDEHRAHELDGQRRWSASIAVPSGAVTVGRPVYFDAVMKLSCSDSVPFVTVFADRKTLPGWAQDLFSVADVSGEARLQLGHRTVELSPGVIRGGPFEVELRYFRDGPATLGDLFATAGPLSLGVTLRPGGTDYQFGSRRRFDDEISRPLPRRSDHEQ